MKKETPPQKSGDVDFARGRFIYLLPSKQGRNL
jgi:hypothetical protein